MIKFFLQRPIAVLMAFTACFIIGLVTYSTLPVSLLPDIAIPEITIQVTGENTSARELENTVVRPIRTQLMQLAHLRDMRSEIRDGSGVIRLSFDYGTNTDLAFIEVNEKIDAAMGYLPRETERPRVIKASATDIPVLYLNLTLKTDNAYKAPDSHRFLELSEFAENIVKRRIEQLQEVAMVDRTGVLTKQLQIIPDMEKMETMGISIENLESVLSANNIEPGSMVVKEGYYEYNIRFSSILRTPQDVEEIYIRRSDYMLQLKDIAQVYIAAKEETGSSLYNGKQAVTLAIIKQADENMDNMKVQLQRSINYFERNYPDIEFSISRNQTELLDYTISNLQQNLALGFLFIFVVAILFLGDAKSPLIIGLSMIVSLVISFSVFYLFGMSLNIISLSGLILAQGMMVDNSIIVTENISQYRERGYTLEESCRMGTTEVITPMLSSSLTTISVFIPLVFLSGIAGAIFYDEAFAITVGLTSSYFTGIILLPVLYKLVYSIPVYSLHSKLPIKKGAGALNRLSALKSKLKERSDSHPLDRWYIRGVDYIFSHKMFFTVLIILVFPVCVCMFYRLDKSRMPEIDQTELMMNVDWNENIHLDENRERVNQLTTSTDHLVMEHSASVGQQQYLLNRENELSSSEAEIYFRTERPEDIEPLQKRLFQEIKQRYPTAVFNFTPPENIFEKVFVTGEADLVVELYSRNKARVPTAEELRTLERRIAGSGEEVSGLAFENQLNIRIDREKLLLYQVSYNEVVRILKTAFKENNAATLRSFQQYIPISIAGEEKSVNEILRTTLVQTEPDMNRQRHYIPLQSLISISPSEDVKTITAGKNGEYIPFSFYNLKNPATTVERVKQELIADNDWDVDFSGAFFSNKQMINELTVILFISFLLMYFILAAQFESFLQPLIVLMEIPIDVAFALVLLWLTGHTLNLMSAIGIVVSCGVIINDSILKIDVINELRKQGYPLMEAIHEGGRRRLRAIIMTSLTTICAMIPLLFSFDMGSELQKPLAIAMIGTMALGTLVSLFIIPLIYWAIYRKTNN